MAVQTVPYALQNASHSAALFRQSASAAFRSGGALSSIELVVRQQASPNMSVILGPGRAKVTGTSVSPPAGQSFTTQAMYDTLNDADATLTIAASNPTNPRIDLVYIQVQDSFYSGAANQAIAGVVTGTPAAIPAVPATPANAVAISTVAVAAGATSIVNANIGRVISRAQILGAPRVVADLDALAALTDVAQSDVAYVTEMLVTFAYTGGVWLQTGAARFSSTAARDTAYAKASGAYRVSGIQCIITTAPLVTMQYNGASWQKLGLVKPTTAVATNGVSTINDDGSVTIVFAGAGNVILNNIFLVASTYDSDIFDVVITWIGSASTLFAKLCAGGTPDPATNLHSMYGPGGDQAAAYAGAGYAGQASWYPSNGISAIELEGTLQVRHANDNTRRTKGFIDILTTVTQVTAEKAVRAALSYAATTAFDGLQFLVSAAGTLNVRVQTKA